MLCCPSPGWRNCPVPRPVRGRVAVGTRGLRPCPHGDGLSSERPPLEALHQEQEAEDDDGAHQREEQHALALRGGAAALTVARDAGLGGCSGRRRVGRCRRLGNLASQLGDGRRQLIGATEGVDDKQPRGDVSGGAVHVQGQLRDGDHESEQVHVHWPEAGQQRCAGGDDLDRQRCAGGCPCRCGCRRCR